MSKQYIGSTDAATILGVNPWGTEDELVARILHDIRPEVDEKQAQMFRLGAAMEPVVLGEFAFRTGMVLTRPARMFHVKHSFIGDTPDAMTDVGDCVEAKTSVPFPGVYKKWGEPGTDQVPENYRAQALHHMLVTGAPRCWIPVLFGTHRYDCWVVERDEQAIEDLLTVEMDFWCSKIQPFLKEAA